jgi:predicted DNA-binding protein with PD1-like motif
MEYRKIDNHYVVRMEKGDEVTEKLKELCRKENIRLGSLIGLGASDHVSIGLFDDKTKVYDEKTLDRPMEITSLVGNITTMNGEPYLHCHINVCDGEMRIYGGHMTECRISVTGEIFVTPLDGTVERKRDDSIGVNLFSFE